MPGLRAGQDAAHFTYGQDQSVGLGLLNGSARGRVGHAAPAVSPDGVPLGVLSRQLWGNMDTPVPGYKLQMDPEIVRCASARWAVTLAGIQEALPAGQAALVLADRESDVTGYRRAPRRPGIEPLLRAVGGRKVNGAVREADPLHTERGVLAEVVAQAPGFGLHTVAVPAQPARPGCAGQSARLASLEIRVAAVRLPVVAATQQRQEQPVAPRWTILAVDPEPPAGTSSLCWRLLTTLAVADPKAALAMIALSTQR